MISASEYVQFRRQIDLIQLGYEGQVKLKHSKLLCIGLGGLGSILTLYLAAAGVQEIDLMDPDIIEISNLPRQILFGLHDQQRYKTEVTKRVLKDRHPEMRIKTFEERFSKFNLASIFECYDLIIDATDNFPTRYAIHDLCYKLDKPYIYASAIGWQGQIAFFQRSNGACLHCLYPLETTVQLDCRCENSGVLNIIPGIMGTLQALEVIKWILGLRSSHQNRLTKIDALAENLFQQFNLQQDPECEFCSVL